jgi:hypothetical protein
MGVVGLAGLVLGAGPLPACSLCNINIQQTATFRQDIGHAKMILFGTLSNPRLGTGAGAGSGVTEFHIKTVIKSHPWLGTRKMVEVPRYLPVSDPRDPPKYLLFCEVFQNNLDIFRGVPVKSEAAATYVKGLLALEGKPQTEVLRYGFDYLDHPDPELSQDAYIGFAKASDKEVGEIAPKLSAAKLRRWLQDPAMPENRLGLFAFLLGACGGADDAALLRSMIDNPTEKTQGAFDGLLGGYIHLKPREGWKLALDLLRDQRKPFAMRFAIVRMLRFYQGWQPKDSRVRVMEGMAVVLGQNDLADLAIDDLRRWKVWDLTPEIFRLYEQKGYDAPIMQRAIVRYALECPRPEAAGFLARVRHKDPELYNDLHEALEFEKKARTGSPKGP